MDGRLLLLLALMSLAGFVAAGIVGSWFIDRYLYPQRSRATGHAFEVQPAAKESQL